MGQLGDKVPTVVDIDRFKAGFTLIQELLADNAILAGHDVSSGGVLGAACEMAFAGDIGVDISLEVSGSNLIEQLFCEKPAVLLQLDDGSFGEVRQKCTDAGLRCLRIGEVRGTQIRLHSPDVAFSTSVADLRRVWFKPSFLPSSALPPTRPWGTLALPSKSVVVEPPPTEWRFRR